MRLTHHTDFSLRVLIFLALQQDDKLVTTDEVAKHFSILKNHLTKVVHKLAKQGYIKAIRGKNGGICLAREASSINLGEVVQVMENNIEVVDCQKPVCPLVHYCELKNILNESQNAFYSVLEQYTLADISKHSNQIRAILQLN